MSLKDSTEDRRTPEQQAAQDEADAEVLDFMLDAPLQEVRERSKECKPGDYLDASDGRRYKVGTWIAGQSWPTLRRVAKAGDDAAALQKESRSTIRIGKALAKLANDGFDEVELSEVKKRADKVVRTRAVDGDGVTTKMQLVLEDLLNMCLTGELKPRSFSEAVSSADTLARLLMMAKVDAAAVATEAVIRAGAEHAAQEYQDLLARIDATVKDPPKKAPGT